MSSIFLFPRNVPAELESHLKRGNLRSMWLNSQSRCRCAFAVCQMGENNGKVEKAESETQAVQFFPEEYGSSDVLKWVCVLRRSTRTSMRQPWQHLLLQCRENCSKPMWKRELLQHKHWKLLCFQPWVISVVWSKCLQSGLCLLWCWVP